MAAHARNRYSRPMAAPPPHPSTTRRNAALACAATMLLTACAGRTRDPQTGPPSPGDTDGPPALGCLPGLPPDRGPAADRTRQGLLILREAFAEPLPAAPPDADAGTLQRWVDASVVPWLRERSERLAQARFEFEHAQDAQDAQAPQTAARIVSLGAGALLQESTARQLSSLPAPRELDTEPMIREVYREVVDAQARPFLSSALVDYRQCADLAHDGPESMRHWALFCHGRFARLRAEIDAAQRRIAGGAPEPAPASGETTTVVVEEVEH